MKKKEKITVNSSVSMLRNSKIFAPEIIANPKYQEIHEKFEKVFKAHGYFLSDSFDKKVWFLKDDIFFQKIINKNNMSSSYGQTPTPNPDGYEQKNRIHEILSELNENTDYAHLLVNVEKFIYRVIENVLIANATIERSQRTIKSFNAIERKQNIEECIRILEEKIEKNGNYSGGKKGKEKEPQSRLKTKILKTIDFEPGAYSFDIKYYEIIPEKDNFIMRQGESLKNKKVFAKIFQNEQTIEEFNEFNDISFFALPSILNSTAMKIKNNTNSGTSLSNFSIVCSENNSGKFESKKIYCLEIILNTLDSILDISRSYFRENIEIKLFQNPNSGQINKERIDSNLNNQSVIPTIILEMLFEFDEITRASVLRRISLVFKEVLDTLRINQDLLNLILDSYFDSVNESIRNILHKSSDPQKDACCDCVIF